jgi:hypothetical protein
LQLKNNRLKKLFALLLFAPLLSLAQGRKYSNAFLEIGVDARSMALSNSVIASTNDVNATYWNPAGLMGVRDSWQASAMHAEYFASIAQYDYAAFAAPIDATSTAGVALIRFGVDDILDTTELLNEDGNVDYDRINRFSAADYALIASYARSAKNNPNLRFGGSVKIIYRQIGDFANAIGFGLDAGLQYQLKGWLFGATLRDVTSTFNAWTINEDALGAGFFDSGNELPTENLELTLPRLLLGAGRNFKINEDYSLQTELNAEFTFGGRENTLVSANFGNINPGVGLELGYRDFAFLRAGAGNVQRLRDFNGNREYTVKPNLGIGFKYRGISIDYALTDIGSTSGALYSNIFSVNFNFSDFKKS